MSYSCDCVCACVSASVLVACVCVRVSAACDALSLALNLCNTCDVLSRSKSMYSQRIALFPQSKAECQILIVGLSQGHAEAVKCLEHT